MVTKGFAAPLEAGPYVAQTFLLGDPGGESLLARSKACGLREIHLTPLDARHLEVFTRLVAPRRALEIGTLGGYSAVHLARGLAKGGHLWTIERDPKAHEFACAEMLRRGLPVTCLLGEALEVLPGAAHLGPFDLVFLDADKANYPAYLQWATHALRPGGLLLADNTLAWGQVGRGFPSPEVQGVEEFNARLGASREFCATLLPTGAGLCVAVRLG